jgi:hypothetical protein
MNQNQFSKTNLSHKGLKDFFFFLNLNKTATFMENSVYSELSPCIYERFPSLLQVSVGSSQLVLFKGSTPRWQLHRH